MEETKTPTIYINGTKTMAIKPKAYVWREYAKFMDKQIDNPNLDCASEYARLVALVFPNVTTDKILHTVNIEDLKPLFVWCMKWVNGLVDERLSKFPKAESPVNLNLTGHNEYVIYTYNFFHEAFCWTLQEIDNTELTYLMDLLVVRFKTKEKNEPELVPIDSVL